MIFNIYIYNTALISNNFSYILHPHKIHFFIIIIIGILERAQSWLVNQRATQRRMREFSAPSSHTGYTLRLTCRLRPREIRPASPAAAASTAGRRGWPVGALGLRRRRWRRTVVPKAEKVFERVALLSESISRDCDPELYMPAYQRFTT